MQNWTIPKMYCIGNAHWKQSIYGAKIHSHTRATEEKNEKASKLYDDDDDEYERKKRSMKKSSK